MHKIQDFQESCLDRYTQDQDQDQDQDKSRYTQVQYKTRLVYKIQEILSKLKTLENIDELNSLSPEHYNLNRRMRFKFIYVLKQIKKTLYSEKASFVPPKK